MPVPIIKLHKLCKVFSNGEMLTHALIDINLDIYPGDYLSISGPSGCGKSTLLSLIGLLDVPSKGHLYFAGNDVSSLSLEAATRFRNEKIGFVFQQFNLIDELTVFDNIALPLRYAKRRAEPQQITDRVNRLLQLMGLTNKANDTPKQLSGGQQQRVAIARALVAEPDILLVDEPTGNLDSKHGEEIMTLLLELNEQGTTICLVTHDPNFAAMAKQQLYLLDGQVLGQTK